MTPGFGAVLAIAAPAASRMAEGQSGWLEGARQWVTQEGPGLLMALLTLVLGWQIARALRGALRRVLKKRRVDDTLIGFLGSVLYAGAMTVVVISAAGRAGFETTSFVAVLGAAGLAVGLALQGSLSNFASGVLIILFRPFRSGDFVELAGVAGKVVDVQIFATILETGDNKRVIVPNGSITSGTIVNYSANETRRIDLEIGVGYSTDLRAAQELFREVLERDEAVLKDPEAVVAVSALGDSAIQIVVRPWVRSQDYWATRWRLTQRLKEVCDQEGIEIPFPKRDVMLHSVES